MQKPSFTRIAQGLVLAAAMGLGIGVGSAQAKPDRLQQDTLADQHVVIQISEGDPFKQKIVLNNVANMLKHYGPDRVQIEVVAYGPGLRLLFDDNANKDRINSMMQQGVTFSACSNTMANMGKGKGDLIAGARSVPGGVVQIMERQDQGWEYIRP